VGHVPAGRHLVCLFDSHAHSVQVVPASVDIVCTTVDKQKASNVQQASGEGKSMN
jgi:hypothetical protein